MFWIAQIVGFIAVVVNVISVQLKRKEKILLFFATANFLFSVNFVLLKSYTGGIICFIAGIQTIISYLYERKNKKLPKVFIPFYIIISVICGFLSYQKAVDILPVICSILYILSIIQKQEKKHKVYNIFKYCFMDNI